MTFQMVVCGWKSAIYILVKCSTLSSTHVWIITREHTLLRSHLYLSAWDKTFPPSNGLLCHFRTHSGKRPFSCSKCDKSFTMSNIVKQHERTHTAEKSFTCSACEKTFTPSNGLLWVIETIRLLKIWQVIQNQMFWSKMREQVLVRNHSIAQHATRHLHHQMVHGFMAFQMILVRGWKNDTWLMAFSLWFLGPIQSMNTM